MENICNCNRTKDMHTPSDQTNQLLVPTSNSQGLGSDSNKRDDSIYSTDKQRKLTQLIFSAPQRVTLCSCPKSSDLRFDQVYIKMYQCFWCLTSFIRFIIKYIFIAYIFSVIRIDTLHYKFGQTSNNWLRRNQNVHSLWEWGSKYLLTIIDTTLICC
jgi:hypothetical protein